MEKTYTYPTCRVTVHGIENWPSERFAPILTGFLESVYGEEEEDAAA